MQEPPIGVANPPQNLGPTLPSKTPLGSLLLLRKGPAPNNDITS